MSNWKRWMPVRGCGWLMPVLPVIIFGLVFYSPFMLDQGRRGGVIMGTAATLVSTLVVVALGLFLNFRPGRVSIDAATGQCRVLRRRHSLLWIPLQWWGLPVLLAGAWFTVGAGAC